MLPIRLSTIISFWSTGLGLRKVSICRDLLRPTNAGLLTQAPSRAAQPALARRTAREALRTSRLLDETSYSELP
jgi:hypothetical protein